jgi:hypothetical protein
MLVVAPPVVLQFFIVAFLIITFLNLCGSSDGLCRGGQSERVVALFETHAQLVFG